jgi:hypothetical protein
MAWREGRLALLTGFLAVVGFSAQVSATVVVPMADEALIHGAAAIVTGVVTGIENEEDGAGQTAYTRVSLRVAEVLKGIVPEGDLVVRQLGGQIGDRHLRIEGAPEFAVGERVLLFLGRHADGAPRVLHQYQGKFSVRMDAGAGAELAVRTMPQNVRRLSSRGVTALTGSDMRPLAEFTDRIRRLAGTVGASPRTEQGALPSTAPTASGTAAFSFGSPQLRWFIEDTGGAPIPIRISATPDPTATGGGIPQVREGIAAWSRLAGSGFAFQDAGFAAGGGITSDSMNLVSFRDPLHQIDPPVSCSGTLGLSGFSYQPTSTRMVNGRLFAQLLEADVVFADGWDGCGFYESFSWLAEVAAHELGHGLGLDHSAYPDSVMYPWAHDDGRGAALRLDDISGLLASYDVTPVNALVGVNATQRDFLPGEPLGIDVWVVPGTNTSPADVYLALQLPDGSLLYLTGGGAMSATAQPYVSGWTATSTTGRVFTYTFGGGEPAGTYRWLSVVVQNGTMGSIQESPFSFDPTTTGAGLELRLNRGFLRSGQPLAVTLLAFASDPPVAADIYVALQTPAGSLLYMHPGGALDATPGPFLSSCSASNAGEIFRYTFGGGEAPGQYKWLAGFASPGTTNFTGPIISAPFSFTP